MTRFYVGCFTSNGHDSDERAIEWMQIEERELWNWINETAGDRWSIEYDVVIDYDYDMGEHGPPLFCDVYVRYQDEAHAVLHKLRWA